MPELDELLRATLDRHATGEVDRTTLIERAARVGRARRRRRRVAMALSATAVAAVVGVGGSLAVEVLRDGSGPSGGSTPAAVALPDAAAAGARTDPAAVGTDPTLIHFAAPEIEAGARFHTWSSAAGYEQLEAGIDDGLVYVTIGGDRATVDASDRQSDLGVVVHSEPVPGLWMRIQATDEAQAEQVAAAVDLDRAQRLILPFQLVHRPAGSKPVSAYLGFVDRRYAQGGVVLEGTGDRRMEVQAQYRRDRDGGQANHTAGGRPAFRYPGADEVALTDVPHLEVSVRIGKAYAGYGLPDADAVLGTLTVTDDVERIESWPSPLVQD